MARLHIHPVGLVAILLNIISFIVALGGLAANTKYCRENSNFTKCGSQYQLEWWSIFFEFFIMVIMLITCFANAFDKARQIYLTFLSISTVLLTLTAREFVTDFFSDDTVASTYKSAANDAAAAGSIMMCVFNFVLIIIVGLAPVNLNQFAPLPTVAMTMSSEQKYQPANF